jgi:uroporphyrinogen-III decarboxylase
MPTQHLSDIHDALAIKRSMEVRREEYLDYMTFQANQRPLFTEIFGPLVGLKEEWRVQGATPEEIDMSAFRFRRPMWANVPVNTGWADGYPEQILEETDDYLIARDTYGRTVKLIKASATLPLPLDHPVRNMDDWLKVKPHYTYSEGRFSAGWEAAARQALQEGQVVSVGIPGGFDEPRQLMGEEALCLAFYEQPELIHDMLDTMGETAFRVLERVSATVQIDQLDVHEDFAGKSGPLIGPVQIKNFLHPYYHRVWDMLAERGARLFSIDSDGNVNSIVPALMDAGINTMLPLEPAAGMDIVKLRAQCGTHLAFVGGLDKHVLRRSKPEIIAELEYKIPPMVRSGGCLLGLDHRIPNGTPLENYRFYIAKVWELLARETHNLNRHDNGK